MTVTELVKQKINKALLEKRFRCASKTYDVHAIVQKQMAKELVKIASKHVPEGNAKMLELGCGTGLLTAEILQEFCCDEYMANDLVGEVEERIRKITANYRNCTFSFIKGDAEQITIPLNQDVIWSGATIQWIEDLDTFFQSLHHSLKSNGFLAISSFDVDNYKEVRIITGKGIEYKPMNELLGIANKYFDNVDYNLWNQQLWFENPKEILKHMQYTGVNSIANTKWGKGDLEHFISEYQMFKQEKGYPLTYNPFVLILKKK